MHDFIDLDSDSLKSVAYSRRIVPVLRTNPHILTISSNLSLSKLLNRLSSFSFHRITHLNLSHNDIEQIPDVHPNVTHLTVTYCRLKCIDTVPGINLQGLDFSNNCIISFPNIFASSRIKSLQFRHNRIRDIPGNVFHILPSLQHLDVSFNPIQRYPTILFQRLSDQTCFCPLKRYLTLAGYGLQQLLQKTIKYGNQHTSIDIEAILETMFPDPDSQGFQRLMEISVQVEYCPAVRYFSKYFRSPDQQNKILHLCSYNNRIEALGELLNIYKVYTGYNRERAQLLDPKLYTLFSVNNIKLKHLVDSICHNILRSPDKCIGFLNYLYGHRSSLLQTEQDLVVLLECRDAKAVKLLLQYQIEHIVSQLFLAEPVIVNYILEMDDIQIFCMMMQSHSFSQLLFKLHSKPSKKLTPNQKIFKFVLAAQKQHTRHQLERPILTFRQYYENSSQPSRKYPRQYHPKSLIFSYEAANTLPCIPVKTINLTDCLKTSPSSPLIKTRQRFTPVVKLVAEQIRNITINKQNTCIQLNSSSNSHRSLSRSRAVFNACNTVKEFNL